MSRDSLERHQIPLYVVAVLLAVVGGLLMPASAQRLEAWVTPLIAVLMYAMFLQIPLLELRQGLRDRRFIGALLLANFVLLPCMVWVLTRGLVPHPALLVGALLVLLAPCIDYVVVFTHLGKGDARAVLAATPLLLLIQLAMLPFYLTVMLPEHSGSLITLGPFLQAFAGLIVAPLLLAGLTCALARRSRTVGRWHAAWAWLPVPAMAAVLIVVIGSQVATVAADIDRLLPVIPVYVGFLLLAPLTGALAARLFRLPGATSRAVTFSASTRNSLVVLPLALALPEDIRVLAAAAVMMQTLIELLGELIYIRAIPALLRD